MKNSIFSSLLQLKTKLTDSIKNENELIDKLCNGLRPMDQENLQEFTNASIESAVITLENGETATIVKEANDTFFSIALNKAGEVVEDLPEPITIDCSNINVNIDLDSELVEGYETKLKDVFTSLAHSESTNEAIVKVNELFLSHVNSSSSDCLAAIDTVSGLNSSDIGNLKDYVVSLSHEGKISNYSWASLIANLCKEGQQTTDRGSLIVNKEAFFALQSWLSTVISVVRSVFTVILGILGMIFNKLFSLLTIVLSTLGKFLSATFDLDYQFDVNASYPGIRGTIFAGIDQRLSNILNVDVNTVVSLHAGAEDIYAFKQVNTEQSTENNTVYDVFIQSQPVLAFHPDRFINYLKNVCGLYISQTNVTGVSNVTAPHRFMFDGEDILKLYQPWNIQNQNIDDPMNDPYLTLEDYLQMSVDKNFMVRVLSTNLCALLLGRLNNFLANKTLTYRQDAISINYQKYVDGPSVIGNTNSYTCHMLSIIGEGLMSSSDHPGEAFDHLNYDAARLFLNEIVSVSNNTADPDTTISENDSECYALWHGNVWTSYTINGLIRDNDDALNFLTDDDGTKFPDNIPNDNMIVVPSTDAGTILAVVLLTAAVVAGAIVLGNKIKSALAAKKQVRQAKRVAKINKARDAWLANPTDASLKKAYQKQLSNYNFKASIFGWGSYDSANGWVNAPDSVESTTSSVNNFLNTNSDLERIESLIHTR